MTTALEQIIETIRAVANSLGIPAQDVKVRDLNDMGLSERQLRKYGGLNAIKKAHFPATDKDLLETKSLSEQTKYIAKLEKALATKTLNEKLIVDSLSKIVLPIKVPKAKEIKTVKTGIEREVVVSLNDTHYGLIANSKEIGHVNQYGWLEACRRTALLAQQVAEYKVHVRSEVSCLHVVINGDMLQGVIHDLTARTADLMAIQQCGAAHILTHFIAHVSQFYKKVVVHGVAGNHDDLPHRREGGRVTSHKYDSFLTPVLYGVSLAFRNEKKISFDFPKGLHIDIALPAGRLVVTHGDTLFSKQLGNPGFNLSIQALSDVLNRWNQGEIVKGLPKAKMFMFGHVHTESSFTTYDGVKVYICPSLSGLDSYTHSLGINHNQAGQLIFESTKNHILGDPRMVNVLLADKDASLDAIIPTYQGKLSWT